MEERAERHWLIVWNSLQQTAQVAVRDLLEQLFGLRHEITRASVPSLKERLTTITHCLWMVYKLLQNGLKIRVDCGILGERMDHVERKLDRLARMHLSRDQRKDDRLLHLVAGCDRLLARRSLTMIANANGSAMRSLAIGSFGAQSKSRDMPGSIGMAACLHWSRIESELHELFEFVSRDPIDTLDGVDRQDYSSAFPRERHMESFLGIENDDVLIKVRVCAGDHPAIYVSSISSGSSTQSPPP